MNLSGRTIHKSERLMRILDILKYTALNTTELRKRLGLPDTQTRTLQRDLELLVEREDLVRRTDGRYTTKARKPAALNPAEALAAYSAARLLFHHASEYNEHYLTTLEKLTHNLPEPVRKVAEQMNRVYREKPNRRQSRSLEHCSLAWLEGRWLKFDYHAPSTGKKRTVELSIYFIEINPHNRSAYAIGFERTSKKPSIRVFKVSRMMGTLVLNEPCEIPEDFNALGFMQHAWGVSVGDPQKLVLRFKPEARERLLEEHLEERADRFELLEDGFTCVDLTVANVWEVVPWIKGWGAWVRVEEPLFLRDELIRQLQEALEYYSDAEPQEVLSS
ncbi:helix-turn-helix transcriptional regulator [Deinococcus cellulosilyticus]|uniref:DNA-binding transcriptional regulator n=1 Tax=Deinococcus cellulosilyticus (strain DSM 18568 / NBRC 106333 / KACC 11606 / 5516J-15) TaxID=1223518 RepID=A0A511N269_DEIC1|nr:WYL domain-containing protein [Deinococcus cellulosilyticus]GEM46954.1 DNA-binding transcriptional regulator [Deinococcus cellulosilyticus NBRC 106333 = KACC 11606]